MSDDWKTPSQPRLIGHLNDCYGHSVAISVDGDGLLVRHLGRTMRFRTAEREHFQRLFMEAEREIEAVDAEVWCALDGGCLQGPPGTHLFGPSCVTEAEAEVSDG